MFTLENLLYFLGCFTLWLLTLTLIWQFASFLADGGLSDVNGSLWSLLLRIIIFGVVVTFLSALAILAVEATCLFVGRIW